jgi:hypothetical protein
MLSQEPRPLFDIRGSAGVCPVGVPNFHHTLNAFKNLRIDFSASYTSFGITEDDFVITEDDFGIWGAAFIFTFTAFIFTFTAFIFTFTAFHPPPSPPPLLPQSFAFNALSIDLSE